MPNIVGIANLPNQRHKIVSRKGASLNILLVGESGLGKTTFINTLFQTHREETQVANKSVQVTRSTLVENGFSLDLAVIDCPGFGDSVDNSNHWVPIADFVDKQHANFLAYETTFNKPADFVDLRVHICIYFIPPTGHTYLNLLT